MGISLLVETDLEGKTYPQKQDSGEVLGSEDPSVSRVDCSCPQLPGSYGFLGQAQCWNLELPLAAPAPFASGSRSVQSIH